MPKGVRDAEAENKHHLREHGRDEPLIEATSKA
jgi:hypothetical protein